jgi:Arylsulfotransferase (ASST)
MREPTHPWAGTADTRMSRARFLQGVVAGAGAVGAFDLGAVDVSAALRRSAQRGNGRIRRFVSRPDLRPPAVTVVHPAEGTADGYVFVAPSSGPGQRGTLILDDDGEVVWFRPATPSTAMNFRPGLFRGAPVLSWWEGKTEHGLGRGEHVVFDASYREIARFPAGDHLESDLHELLLTPHGTAYVTSYEIVQMDLSRVGGPRKGRVVEGVVQELELPSARVLWEWRSLDHVPLDESYMKKPGDPFDYFHANSIDVSSDGNVVVSARNTWAVYEISRRTGEIIWRLGGKKSDFTMGKGTVFAWQHDARLHAGGERITIFDDGAAPRVQPQSKGLLIALDHVHRRAVLLQDYVHRPQRLVARFMGNAQLLENGNVFVGWGSEPYFTEFAADGAIRFDARLPHGGENYRAFRFPWVGRPSSPPTLVRSPADGMLYASWNGATALASWQLLGGSTTSALRPLLTVPRQGFETSITAPAATYVAAVALDAGGRPLGTSPTLLLR